MEFKKGDVCSLEVVVDEVPNENGVCQVVYVGDAGEGWCAYPNVKDLTLIRRAPVDLATCEIGDGVAVRHREHAEYDGIMLSRVKHGEKLFAFVDWDSGEPGVCLVSDIDPIRPLDVPVCPHIGVRGQLHTIVDPGPLSRPDPNVTYTAHNATAPTCPPGHIMIGDRAVPEPMREAPDVGTFIYSANPGSPGLVGTRRWANDFIDRHQLMSGLIYPGTNEGHRAARAHAEAIIALSAGEGV